MAKPFKVRYSPDEWNAPNGGVATTWTTPYGGLHVQAPLSAIGPNFSPSLNNILLRNSELRSRPEFKQLVKGPDGNNPILGVGSFLSQNNIWHTFAFTQRGLFQLQTAWPKLQASGQNPWVLLGGPALGITPVVWQAYSGILYYTNGLDVSAWDGKANAPLNDVAFTGATTTPGPSATTYGGIFMGELDNHILLAYVKETTGGATSTFPARIRWSNNGFNPIGGSPSTFGGNLGTGGATFDPTISVNAGLNDFLDVPDIITGMMTIGRVGYIFRQNGITELTTTGNGVAPFDFNHLWASQNGIGNVYPFSIAQYGNTGVFISFEQIYQMSPNNMNAIGGGARDAILSDLSFAVGTPVASLDRGFQLGYSFLNYHLRIPQVGGTRSYLFSIEEQNWTTWFTSNVWPVGVPNECWV